MSLLRHTKVILLAGISICCFIAAASSQTWNTLPSLPSQNQLHLVKAVDFGVPILFTAQKGTLYQSSNNGKTWNQTFEVRGTSARINGFEVFHDKPEVWYALTTDGLFQSSNAGKDWTKIYSGIGFKNNNVLSLAQHSIQTNVLYLGCENGAFVSKDGGKNWARMFAELAGNKIYDIVMDESGEELYFASSTALYRYHIGQDLFRQVFSDSFLTTTEANDSETENPDENSSNTNRLAVTIAKNSSYPLVVSAKNGIFASDDEGETWQELPRAGLGNITVTDLVYSESMQILFAATTRGVFKYNSKEKCWEEIYEGLPSLHTFSLTIQKLGMQEKLIAATQKGLFYYVLQAPTFALEVKLPDDHQVIEKMSELLALEPTVREIQKEAIRYANVGNAKIKRWHLGSRFRALVPNVTFNKGLDIGNDIHVDTGSTTTPDTFVQGPDDRKRSTDLNLSWDLADLIWNSSQTSIDSREKLMVELRDQILNEVTRLYFERRRTQLDFIGNPPADVLERTKALFRIDELTANLDALTNGYFSKRLEKVYVQRPDLSEIWKVAEVSTNTNDQSE